MTVQFDEGYVLREVLDASGRARARVERERAGLVPSPRRGSADGRGAGSSFSVPKRTARFRPSRSRPTRSGRRADAATGRRSGGATAVTLTLGRRSPMTVRVLDAAGRRCGPRVSLVVETAAGGAGRCSDFARKRLRLTTFETFRVTASHAATPRTEHTRSAPRRSTRWATRRDPSGRGRDARGTGRGRGQQAGRGYARLHFRDPAKLLYSVRETAETDAEGRFEFHGLSRRPASGDPRPGRSAARGGSARIRARCSV